MNIKLHKSNGNALNELRRTITVHVQIRLHSYGQDLIDIYSN